MSAGSNIPHNPAVAKRHAAAEALNRKRKTASEMSLTVAGEKNAFFDRLALLNAGALTFSVTLLTQPVHNHPALIILYLAWVLLLLALASCLTRNYANIGHRFYSVASSRAEAEVALIEADSEAMTALSGHIMYEDAPEPFDLDRELKINKGNHDAWQNEASRTTGRAETLWKIHQVAEWVAGLTMCAGFLMLIVFAVLSTWPKQKLSGPILQGVSRGWQ